jgi:hypothetical protein
MKIKMNLIFIEKMYLAKYNAKLKNFVKNREILQITGIGGKILERKYRNFMQKCTFSVLIEIRNMQQKILCSVMKLSWEKDIFPF